MPKSNIVRFEDHNIIVPVDEDYSANDPFDDRTVYVKQAFPYVPV